MKTNRPPRRQRDGLERPHFRRFFVKCPCGIGLPDGGAPGDLTDAAQAVAEGRLGLRGPEVDQSEHAGADGAHRQDQIVSEDVVRARLHAQQGARTGRLCD